MTRQRRISEHKTMIALIVASLAAALAGCSDATSNARMGIAPALKRDRHLMLDSRVVATAENARLTVGSVRKDKNNPLFGEDKPWEKRFDNLYPNVVYDPQDKLYKCWYNPFIKDPGVDRVPRAKYKTVRYPQRDRELALCYAFSKDGIHWEKPELGLVEFNGSRKNNIILRPAAGPGIILDPDSPDPSRRYRMFLRTTMEGDAPFAVAFSRDGIHWGPRSLCPGIDPEEVDSTHYNALWAPELKQYVGFTRLRASGGRRAPVRHPKRSPDVRQVGRTTSRDFLNWTQAELIFEGSDPNLQIYSMPVFRHAGVYIGLPVMYDYISDRAYTGLAWSPDTIDWRFVCEGTPLIPNSQKKGDYDWGCAYSSAYPIFRDNEIRLYYGASNGRHFDWRDGFLCLARLRPDGFAGYEQIADAGGKEAIVTTRAIVAGEASLRLSADVTASGYVKVVVLDRRNRKLGRSEPMTETATDSPVKWTGGFSLKKLSGKEIRLRFMLSGAKLYSFSFSD